VAAAGPAAVNLGTAANFAILAESGVSTVPDSVITGDVGVSPIAATALTGFSLTLDPTGEFSTSAQVTGKLYAASYNAPTPAMLTTAVGDMGTAFTDANGRTNPDFVNLGTGEFITSLFLFLPPGLYNWNTAVTVDSNVTISGGATDTWIFQVGGTLGVPANVYVVLEGGALTSNIVWVVTGAVSFAAGAHFEGVVLGQTSIALATGASANSRLLAQTAVTLAKVRGCTLLLRNLVINTAPRTLSSIKKS
ncbi:antifreeze protein, partial [Mycena haematopus]